MVRIEHREEEFSYSNDRRNKEKNVMRSSGVLMHISSLPSPYGIGTMGKEAVKFVDFLEKAGQT